ncbi:MAG: DNA repair exonuclease SbcCD ATPase subunit [Aureispira sp.]|jgi:DNA repair exonuclease SbcCD ATPase subunit
MKTLMLTLFALVALVSTSWGQIDSPVKEETKANSKGSFNALTMELPGTTSKGVQKAWGKFIKKLKGKTKFDRKTNEYIADDATIKDMSDNTVDIIMKIEERGQDGTAISVWFNLGASYLSSKDYAERYPAGEKILKQFANLVSADMIEEELKEAEKQLKELEDLLKKLEKDEAQRIKDIETYRATIQKMEESIITAEGDIKKSEEDQGNTTLTIEEQKKIVEDIQKRLDSVK